MGQGMGNRLSLLPTESSLCVNKGLTLDGLLGGLARTALGCDDSSVVPAFFKDHSTRRQETRPSLQQELNNWNLSQGWWGPGMEDEVQNIKALGVTGRLGGLEMKS